MAVDQRKQQQSDEQQQQQQDAVSTEYLVHNWLEALFAWFQVIVLWHEPNVSFCAISGLLSSFLLFTYFAPRFYAIIMIAIFFYNLNKFWFRHVWPEIRVPLESDRELEMRLDVDRWTLLHPQLMTLSELKYHIRNLKTLCEFYLQKLLLLRHRKPAAFCSLLCSIFSCTAFIGSRVSGLSLIFFTLLIIMTAPGIYVYLLPDDYKGWLQQHIQTLISLAHADESVESAQEHDVHGDGGGGGGDNDGEEKKVEASQDQQQAPKFTLESAKVYKETISTSLTSTIKSIESLFDNLKRRNQVLPKSTASVTSPDESVENFQTESHPTTSVLANLREDGAKALINLIDVTLMGANKDRPETTAPTTASIDADSRSQRERRRASSDSTRSDESVPLLDPEEGDQQDDGFVIL